MNNKIMITMALLFWSVALWGNRMEVENYGVTCHVKSLTFDTDGNLLLATPGGLGWYNYDESKLLDLYHNSTDFPDISLTALLLDSEENLWIGTESGILYRRDRDGNQEAFHDLALNDASINIIAEYGDILLIGHRKGISTFDKKSLSYRGTATLFAKFSNKSIIDIKINNDTLFALYDENPGNILSFGNLAKGLLTLAFSTPSSWEVKEFFEPNSEDAFSVNSFQIDSQKGLIPFSGLSLPDGDEYVYSIDSTIYRAHFIPDTVSLDPLIIEDSLHATDSSTLKSNITALTKRDDGKIVTGHEWYTFYKRPFEGNGQKDIRGLRRVDIQKLFLQSNGVLWTIPEVAVEKTVIQDKNELISIKGDEFKYYGSWIDGFGSMGNSNLFTAVAEGPDGAMWFGNSSDHVKRFKDGKWQRLIIDKSEPYIDKPYFVSHNKIYPDFPWMKVEGVFVDDDNTIWGTHWHNEVTDGRPMFWVYNVHTEQYKYWGVTTQKELSPYQIVEGAHGNKLFIFRWHSAPGYHYEVVDGEVDILDTTLEFESLFIDRDTLEGEIAAVTTSEYGTFVFATEKGLVARHYNQGEKNPVRGSGDNVNLTALTVGNSYSTSETVTINDKDSVVDFLRTDVWVGVKNGGFALYFLKEYKDDKENIVKLSIEAEAGLNNIMDKIVATNPKSMVYDKKNDNLWIASLGGLSRVVMARNTMPYEDNEKFYVYPNPFRKKEHTHVTIKNVSKDAYVDIYTSSGQLVDHLTREGEHFVEEDEQGIYFYQWKPSSKLAPGTYFVIAKSEDRSSVVLNKLLILP